MFLNYSGWTVYRAMQLFDYSWIVSGEIEQLTKVNSNLGLSQLMLYNIYAVI
jgi:hypothetical protein